MDEDRPAPRKVKFTPKKQAPRKRPTGKNNREEEANDDIQAQKLLQHLSERGARRRQKPKLESTSAVQPAYVDGQVNHSTSIASSVPKGGSIADYRAMKEDSSPETEYMEPWDYYSNYPTTLPWRRPYSGDPDILNEAEFGEAALRYDEKSINPAAELGLMDPDEGSNKLLFIQLPHSLPIIKRSSVKGKEKEGNSEAPNQKNSATSALGGRGSSSRGGASERCMSLDELQAGLMGKLLVYKSGAVKLKLGDALYDVSPGVECSCAQELVAVNTKEKGCSSVGEIHKQLVVTPDIEHLMNSTTL